MQANTRKSHNSVRRLSRTFTHSVESNSSVCATLTRTAHTIPTKREMGTIGFEPMLRNPGISLSATCPLRCETVHVQFGTLYTPLHPAPSWNSRRCMTRASRCALQIAAVHSTCYPQEPLVVPYHEEGTGREFAHCVITSARSADQSASSEP